MSVFLSPLGGAGAQFFDNNGVILTGGKIYTYAAGTTTPQTSYTSSSGATAHANPIVLDSAGRVPGGEIWLTNGLVYKFTIETSASVLLGTYDNISGINAVNAEFVIYDPPFTGAVSTNVEAKLAQTLSVKDFGAVGNGVTNDTAAFNLAIAACSTGQSIYVPAGNYIVTVASLVYGTKVISFNCSPGALINGTAGTEGFITAGEYGNTATYGPHAPANGFMYNKYVVNDAYPSAGSVAGKVDGLAVVMVVGGATAKGGRHGIESTLILNQATSPSNFDRNYVGVQGVATAYVNDNGTALSPQGAVFGFSALGVLTDGATHYLNVTGGEVNVSAKTGTSVFYKCGLQIAAMPDDIVKGSDFDASLSLSNQLGAIGFDYGVMFSAANGAHPVSTTGTLIGTKGAATVANGIDFSSYTISGSSFKATNIDINSNGMEIGPLSTATTPVIDFHSSGNNIDYDSRIVASSGTATVGQGFITFIAKLCVLSTLRITPSTVANLITAVDAGAGGRATVTDATATLAAGIGTVVVGGGANIVPVFSNGTNWIIG